MKEKVIFICESCGNESIKWQGKCPACGEWNTLAEQKAPVKTARPAAPLALRAPTAGPQKLTDPGFLSEERIKTNISELDAIFGGGIVKGTVSLLGGAPGVGKSTLLLQLCAALESLKILYISGEESPRQIKMRAQRLGAQAENIYLLTETNMEEIASAIEAEKPDFVVVDSIQTIFDPALSSSPGSVTQVKECAMRILSLAKSTGLTAVLVGHVNKEGAIAGPKVLEHMVDCVFNFEGDNHYSYRILRSIKNRFGSTNEIGVFEMTKEGMREVKNPSFALLSERSLSVPGNCITSVMEGSRPILAEVQALASRTAFSLPRRTFSGLAYSRGQLLIAILEKRVGLNLSMSDIYVNITGGLYVDEPALDLSVCLAITSAVRDVPLPDQTATFGEVGLGGEVRGVKSVEMRVLEAKKMGFTACIVPRRNLEGLKGVEGIDILPVRTLAEAIRAGFKT